MATSDLVEEPDCEDRETIPMARACGGKTGYLRPDMSIDESYFLWRNDNGLPTTTSLARPSKFRREVASQIKSLDSIGDIWLTVWAPPTDDLEDWILSRFIFDKRWRSTKDQYGNVVMVNSCEIRFLNEDGTWLEKDGEILAIPESQWATSIMMGASDNVGLRFKLALGFDRPISELQGFEIAALRANRLLHDSNLVSTLDKDTLIHEIENGILRSYPLSRRMCFRFLDRRNIGDPANLYPLVGTDSDKNWTLPISVVEKYNHPKWTVALCLEDEYFMLLAFERSQDTQGDIKFQHVIEKTRKHFLSSKWHRTKPSRTHLFKELYPRLDSRLLLWKGSSRHQNSAH